MPALLAMSLLPACSTSPTEGVDGVDIGATTFTEPTGTHGSGDVVSALVGVEVEVSNAVAPFDHFSNVDSLLLELSLAKVRTQLVFDCLVRKGFPEREVSDLPSRDDPLLMANAAFPYIEALALHGLPVLPTTAPSPDGTPGRSVEEQEASRACAEEVDGSGSDAVVAGVLFGSVRGAWEMVLGEVDATDEIRSLVDDFGSCLRDEGIPPESTTSEVAYLSYVDFLLAAASVDPAAFAEASERMGKLYVECGRELFELRERVRGGERRDAFLRQHQEAISQLSDLVYGTGSDG